jgi:hypothetical protein
MHQMRISTNRVSSAVLRPKKLEIRKEIENSIRVWKKRQILCHEIEPNPLKDRAMHEGNNPSFWDESIKFTFSEKFYCTEVLSNWAVETLGDL